MDIELDGKTDAPDESGKAKQGKGRHIGRGLRRLPPKPANDVPAGGGAQGNGHRNEEYLDDPVDAGIGIPVYNIPHGVGEEQSGNQDHQGADNDTVGMLGKSQIYHGISGKGHEKSGSKGGKERIHSQIGHGLLHEANEDPAESRAQGIGEVTAEKHPEAGAASEVAQHIDGGGIAPGGVQNMLQPSGSFLRFRMTAADGPAQAVKPLHGIQVVAVEADPPHSRYGLAGVGKDAHHQEVGNGEHIGLHAKAFQDPVHTVFHPEGLRASHGKLIAHIRGQVKNGIVIHWVTACIFSCLSIPYPTGNARGFFGETKTRSSLSDAPGNAIL